MSRDLVSCIETQGMSLLGASSFVLGAFLKYFACEIS